MNFLKASRHFGDFLAFQFAIDINYTNVIDHDEATFVVAGPGARDGLAKTFSDPEGTSAEALIEHMMNEQEAEFDRLGLQFRSLWGRPLQLIDCQNFVLRNQQIHPCIPPGDYGALGSHPDQADLPPAGPTYPALVSPEMGLERQHPRLRCSQSLRPIQRCRMNFSEYQHEALRSDRTPVSTDMSADAARLIPLLGLAGEAGQLVAEYKKRLRDGPGHVLFVDRVAEELGDILWYVANLASKYDLDLDAIASQNLSKVASLHFGNQAPQPFDAEYGESERFPRRLVAIFRETREGSRVEVRTEINGRLVGSALTDNAYQDDGYRFHDVFHLAYAAVLGWSPVMRRLMRLKRRSRPLIDEVEDGGRAAVIEEGIAAVAFDYARKHQFLKGVSGLDEALLTTLQGMGTHLEVASQPTSAWTQAVMDGFSVWRDLVEHGGGRVEADLDRREIRYIGPEESAMTTAAADAAE